MGPDPAGQRTDKGQDANRNHPRRIQDLPPAWNDLLMSARKVDSFVLDPRAFDSCREVREVKFPPTVVGIRDRHRPNRCHGDLGLGIPPVWRMRGSERTFIPVSRRCGDPPRCQGRRSGFRRRKSCRRHPLSNRTRSGPVLLPEHEPLQNSPNHVHCRHLDASVLALSRSTHSNGWGGRPSSRRARSALPHRLAPSTARASGVNSARGRIGSRPAPDELSGPTAHRDPFRGRCARGLDRHYDLRPAKDRVGDLQHRLIPRHVVGRRDPQPALRQRDRGTE